MKILENEILKKYTTIKIGGIAKKIYIPESIEELIDTLVKSKNEKLYLIGGGSNLLINDKKLFEKVILLKKFNKVIEKLENNKYYVGASVPLVKLIKTTAKDGYGGIEYLYSLPALVGGAIFMNAGRGRKFNLSISDFIETVHVYDCNLEKEVLLKKEDCLFSYRKSIFHIEKDRFIILGATFKFEYTTEKVSSERIKNRIKYVKGLQDSSGHNFGSVFNTYNKYLMYLIKLVYPKKSKGITFSKKTSNWLLNKGTGNYTEAIRLIKKVEFIHKVFFQKSKLEVIIWE